MTGLPSAATARRERSTSFSARLRACEPLIGTVLSSPDPILAERIAQAFDFVWIDLEHSALSVRDAVTLAIAVKAGAASSLIRVPRCDSELINAVLDTGVDGVIAPKISSAADAARFASSLRYPPGGSRGFAPRRASGGHVVAGSGPAREVACIVQIETREALDHLDAIAATEGVDGMVVGLADLSLDLSRPLDMEADDLVAAAERVARAAGRHGMPWGLAAGTLPDWVRASWATDACMLVYSSDLRLYGETIDAAVQRLRELRPSGVNAPSIDPGVAS